LQRWNLRHLFGKHEACALGSVVRGLGFGKQLTCLHIDCASICEFSLV